MNIEQLLNGIVVVIDDEINSSSANINNIITQLKEKKYPVLEYDGIQGIDVKKFVNVSFLILDWDLAGSLLDKKAVVKGVKIPNLGGKYIVENIKFIKELIDFTFFPIFILSNQDIDHIKAKLISEKIIYDDKSNRIFVKSKRDVGNHGQLFTEIETWLKNAPSMYVLKEWENEHQKAITTFFNEFQKYSLNWPVILWKCFKDDEVNPSLELADLLARNLNNRMRPFEFCGEILEDNDFEPKKDEIRKVLEGERFLPNEALRPDDIGIGDLFKVKSSYYLNIRPQCDLVRENEVMIYCVKGTTMTKTKEKTNFLPEYGHFSERSDKEIIPFINNGKIIEFCFKELEVISFDKMKANRIGRLLPPYITKLQQRYSLYLQRQGLPRIPVEAIDNQAE
jgi:hypothetical protein